MLSTATHLIEIEKGLMARSCSLPDNLGKVKMIRLVLRLGEDRWSYLVQGQGGRVVFVKGEGFTVGKKYEGVEEVAVGDFLGSGERLVRLSLGFGEVVLTDGEVELETDQRWPPQEGGEVGEVLRRRLGAVDGAVGRARAEQEVIRRQLEQAVVGLGGRLVPGSLLGRGEVRDLLRGEGVEKRRQDVRVGSHWWRLLGSSLVLGLELETGGRVDEVGLLMVRLGGVDLSYSSSLVRLVAKREGGVQPERVQGLGVEGEVQGATMVVTLNLGELALASSSLTILASLSYTKQGSALQTEPKKFTLPTKDLYSNPSPILPSLEAEAALPSLLALYTTGVGEELELVSRHGSLLHLPSLLSSLGLTYLPTVGVHFFTSPHHPLHLCGLQPSPVSPQTLLASLYAPDYTKLGLLVGLLRQGLPKDTTFTVVES